MYASCVHSGMEETVAVVVSFPDSLAQEKMVRLKRDMRIICIILFIFFLPSPVMIGKKLEKSHIHIFEPATLSR